MSGPAPAGARNPDLDGLRGLAALSVALGHCFLQVTGLPLWATSLRDFPSMPAPQIIARLVSALLPSDAAVMIFFVLSGHVLWRSFRRGRKRFLRDLPDYACARLYRLLPLSIVSAVPLALLINAPAADMARNMLLLSHSINEVLWTLQVEIVASFALFVIWGLTRDSPWRMGLALAVAVAAVPFCRGNPLVVFLPAFILGASIDFLPDRMKHSASLLAMALVVLLFSNILLGHGGIDRCLEMLGATILVGSVSQGALPFLRRRVPLFLGALSYPFYLTHVIGLILVTPLLERLPAAGPYTAFAARAALSIPPTLLIAWLLHGLVEIPAQRGRPRLEWPFTLRWSVGLRPLVPRPMQADVPALATPDRPGPSTACDRALP